MLKTAFLRIAFFVVVASSASAIPINLDPFNSDFNTLMNGIARDVAPTLRLNALAGDIQGDATIDTFNLSLVGLGVSTADGVAKVLKPGAARWDFVLPLADLVNDNVGDNNFFEELMPYPGAKIALGFSLKPWDFSVSASYLPQSVTEMALGFVPDSDVKISSLSPKVTFGNFGFVARRTLINDSGFIGLVPAVSLGAGYHYTYFDLGVNLSSLSDLGVEAPSVGEGQTIDMAGAFGVNTNSQVFTVDLHVSKHLLNLTPYMKLSAAYQNSTFEGSTNLKATITDTTDNTSESQTIVSRPVVNVSDFAFLVTSGLDVNLLLVNLNVNMVADMSRALLKVRDLSLKGIDANAVSLNAGVRISF